MLSTFLEGSVVGVVLPLFLSFVLRVAKSGDFPKTMDVFKAQLPTVLRRLGRILSRFSHAECRQTVQVAAAEGRKEKVIVHETNHPYEQSSKHFRVHIPGCQSLTLKFDPQCCIRGRDRLVVSGTRQADQNDEQPASFEFSGRFFRSETDGRERAIHGDTVDIDFCCQPAVPAPSCGIAADDTPKDGSIASVEADSEIKPEANSSGSNATGNANTLTTTASLSTTASTASTSNNGENRENKSECTRAPIPACDEEDVSVAAASTVTPIAQTPGTTGCHLAVFCFDDFLL